MRFTTGGVAFAAVLVLAAPAAVCAQAPAGAGLVGRRVVQKARDLALRDDKQAATGNVATIHIYRIERVDGSRVWLKAEGKDGRPNGWVEADQVVPLDQAVAFFIGRIRANAEDGFSCLMRSAIKTGVIESQRDLMDSFSLDRDPFADLNEVIRPDAPRAATARDVGDIWLRSVGGDTALADFNEAIRLDPGDAAAYYGRGLRLTRDHMYE